MGTHVLFWGHVCGREEILMARNDKVEFGGPAPHSRAVIDGDIFKVEFESGHGPHQVDAGWFRDWMRASMNHYGETEHYFGPLDDGVFFMKPSRCEIVSDDVVSLEGDGHGLFWGFKDVKGCEALDVSGVTDLSDAFHGCSSDDFNPAVGDWDVSGARDVSRMFQGCSGDSFGRDLDLSAWQLVDEARSADVFDHCCGAAFEGGGFRNELYVQPHSVEMTHLGDLSSADGARRSLYLGDCDGIDVLVLYRDGEASGKGSYFAVREALGDELDANLEDVVGGVFTPEFDSQGNRLYDANVNLGWVVCEGTGGLGAPGTGVELSGHSFTTSDGTTNWNRRWNEEFSDVSELLDERMTPEGDLVMTIDRGMVLNCLEMSRAAGFGCEPGISVSPQPPLSVSQTRYVDAFNSTFEVHDGGLSRGSVQREVGSCSPEVEDKPVPKWDGPVYGVDGIMRNFDY